MSDLAEPRREYVPPYIRQLADLRAENARLQAALTEAQRETVERETSLRYCNESVRKLRKQRDGYKALAERRKEALERASWHGIDGEIHWGSKLTDDHTESLCKRLCAPNRAAGGD